MSRFVSLVLVLLVLSGCSSRYQAPVNDVDAEPRFLDSGRTHRVNGGETLYAVAWMYDLDFAALARANNLREPYTITPGQILTVDLRNVPAQSTTGVATTRPVAVPTGIQRAPLATGPLTRQSLPPSEPATAGSTPARDTTAVQGRTPSATTAPAPTVPAAAPQPRTPTPVIQAPVTSPPVTTPPPASAAVTTAPAVTTPPPSTPAPDPNAPVRWDWPARGNIIGRFSDSGVDNKGVDLSGSAGDTVMAAADGEVVYAGNGLLRYGELVILKHNERFLSAYAHNRVITVREGDRVTRGQKIAELGSSGIDRNMLHFEIRLDGKPVDPLVYLPRR
jgi:lipoprotein NlpD